MNIRELKIAGAWEITPRQFGDDRGVFLEWFKAEQFEEITGRRLDIRQANMSISAAGVIRGIHFAQLPPSQGKYVTCPRGAVVDVIVDIRRGSPTYGYTEAVLLDDVDRKAVFLSEGLGHGFCSLEDNSVVTYLCTEPYAPGREFGINPLDADLNIQWPTVGRLNETLQYRFSEKDTSAPSLSEASQLDILPEFTEAMSFYTTLKPLR